MVTNVTVIIYLCNFGRNYWSLLCVTLLSNKSCCKDDASRGRERDKICRCCGYGIQELGVASDSTAGISQYASCIANSITIWDTCKSCDFYRQGASVNEKSYGLPINAKSLPTKSFEVCHTMATKESLYYENHGDFCLKHLGGFLSNNQTLNEL